MRFTTPIAALMLLTSTAVAAPTPALHTELQADAALTARAADAAPLYPRPFKTNRPGEMHIERDGELIERDAKAGGMGSLIVKGGKELVKEAAKTGVTEAVKDGVHWVESKFKGHR